MGMSFAAMLMLLLGGGSSDLLDFVHTDSFWKAKQVTVSVEQLIADASGKAPAAGAPADGGAAGPHAGDVRRLMAIRTLGEMKSAEAVAALQALVESKEPFVADYARASIAAIQGKAAARAVASAQDRATDLWLLPAQCDLVAQVASAGARLHNGDVFGDTPMPPGMDKAQMLEQMTTSLIPVVEMVGNVRLATATVGIYSNAPGQPGYAMIVARGQYDAKAAAATLTQKNVPMTTVDGMDVFQPERSVGILLASDARAVLVIGEPNGTLPLEAVVASIKKDAGGLHDNADITKLIATVDTTQPMWGVVKITDGIRQVVPPAAAFDIATLVVTQKADVLSFALKADGSDAEKVKAAVDEAKTHLDQGIAELRQAVQKLPAAQPVLDAMESVKLASDGGKATATGSLKGPISLPMMFFGMRAEAQVGPGGVQAQPGKPGGL